MFDLLSIINLPPYSLNKSEKRRLHEEALHILTLHHYDYCPQYRRILDVYRHDSNKKSSIENIPFIPVRLFKDYELSSVHPSQIIKTMTSSGTTGQNVSKIFLDRTTATNQTKVLAKITSDLLGKKRLPMLIIDTKSVLKDRTKFSARGAGILGFSMLGTNVTYALDDDMQLDVSAVLEFSKKYKDRDILIFGFTYIIWEYFYKSLASLGTTFDLKKGIMLHGGGWKKMLDQEVDNTTFKQLLKEVSGVQKIHNYYGMVEQTGSIFMECEAGYLHSSIFSDILTRRSDFSICDRNETGLVQLISLLPTSYPGHSILSEDLGAIIGEDDCTCGRFGKYFKLFGRAKNAEIRGCSDTYAKQ